MNAPCKDCEKRYAACHDSCEEFQAYKENRNRILRAKVAENAGTPNLSPRASEKIKRMQMDRRNKIL